MLKNNFKKVFIIDSNKVSNFFNKVTILNLGITKNVEVFDDCLQAFNYFKDKSECSLVFLDLNTPYMNGWEFLEKLLDFPISNYIKIAVMHKGDLLAEEEVKLYEYSFVEYITDKHLEAEEILKIASGKNICNEDLKMTS